MKDSDKKLSKNIWNRIYIQDINIYQEDIFMKKKLFYLPILFLFVMFQGYGFTQQEIVISTGEWPPYTSKKMKHFGYSLHIVSKAFETQGYQVTYKFFPWKRAYAMAEKGEYDGTGVYYKNKKRLEDFYFSNPVSSSTIVIFHRKDKVVEWKTIEDLKKYRIGITLGYSYGDEFNNASKKYGFRLDTSPTDISGFKKILKNRIEIMLCDFGVGYWILQNEFDASQKLLVTNHPKPLIENTVHFIASKKRKDSKEKIEIINKGLMQMKTSGLLEKFLDNLIDGNYSK